MYECETCGAVGNWKTVIKVKIGGDYVLQTYYCDSCAGRDGDDGYMGSDSDFSDHALGIDY